MRKAVDGYLVVYFAGSLAIVVGFTGAGEPPPRWLLVSFLPFLLLALGAVIWLVRQAASADDVAPDRQLELGD